MPPVVEAARRPMARGRHVDRNVDVVGEGHARRQLERRSRSAAAGRPRARRRRSAGTSAPRAAPGAAARRSGCRRASRAGRQLEARDVGQVVGPEQRRDADLPLLEVGDERIVVVARVHDVGRRDAVELPPGDRLHAEPHVGLLEADVDVGLVRPPPHGE